MKIDPLRGNNQNVFPSEPEEVVNIETNARRNVPPQTKPVRDRINVQPNHAYATAKVYIDGLSIMCYRLDTHETEIVFVEPHHSPVSVEVFDKDCEKVYEYTAAGGKKVKISIEKIYAAQHHGGKYYENRKTKDDDYQWMPDLCEWYNRPRMEFWPDAKDYLSAKLVLKDATFYTRVKSINDAYLYPPNSHAKAGRILGGDIICSGNEKGIVMTITDAGSVKFLNRGAPYYIVVKTEARHSDPGPEWNFMDFVYDHIIKLNNGEDRYYLQFKPKEIPLKFDCGQDDWVIDKGKKSTEYACQSYGGGNGDPPPIP